ncbi:uncharacterized protein [Typha latifolia]|uniref:uncharacterized protein n=1 Tax=Typha latifolia TaxID=4733 RepID=UPI003C2C6EA7
MSYSRRSRYDSRSLSRSRSPARSVSRSLSRSRSRSRSEDSSDAENPGNNLYVTGLSTRVTKEVLEKRFASEGEVIDVHLVVDPWTRESRGFGFVTMATIKEANRCIKYLDRSVLEGRVITVEKAKRRRGRTPTPGKYLGRNARRNSVSYSPEQRGRYSYSPYSSERDRSYSPYYQRQSYYRSRSRTPYGRDSRSPVSRQRGRSYSSDPRSYSPDRSVSPYYGRGYYSSRGRGDYCRSPDRSVSPYYRRDSRGGYGRSISHSRSPPRARRYSRRRRSYSRSISPRSFSRSYSPRVRRSRRSYCRSCYSPGCRKRRNPSRSISPVGVKRHSRESYSHSRSACSRSSSDSRSSTPRSRSR